MRLFAQTKLHQCAGGPVLRLIGSRGRCTRRDSNEPEFVRAQAGMLSEEQTEISRHFYDLARSGFVKKKLDMVCPFRQCRPNWQQAALPDKVQGKL
jgi:hypothetical protein